MLAKYVERLMPVRDRQRMSYRCRRPFATIEEAIEDIRQGKMVVVCDDEDRENEGDLDDGRPVRHARGDQLHGQGGRAA